jgi:hypothetical protein
MRLHASAPSARGGAPATPRGATAHGARRAAPPPRRARCGVVPRAEGEGGKGAPALSEDMIARLRAAEEEAAKLKQQLAELQSSAAQASGAVAGGSGRGCGAAARGGTERVRRALAAPTPSPAHAPPPPAPQAPAAPPSGGAVLDAKPQRIDGTDRRETLFSGGGSKRNSWLSEGGRAAGGGQRAGGSPPQRRRAAAPNRTATTAFATDPTLARRARPRRPEDLDWVTGGGPSEASASSGPTAEQQALIQRRVLLGGGATAALAAFALVPTKDLRLKPSKPLYFYLVQLLRVQVRRGVCGVRPGQGGWGPGAGPGPLCFYLVQLLRVQVRRGVGPAGWWQAAARAQGAGAQLAGPSGAAWAGGEWCKPRRWPPCESPRPAPPRPPPPRRPSSTAARTWSRTLTGTRCGFCCRASRGRRGTRSRRCTTRSRCWTTGGGGGVDGGRGKGGGALSATTRKGGCQGAGVPQAMYEATGLLDDMWED